MPERMKGFWRRPVSRTYGYNLDVGQHYYSHHTDYLDSGSRGEAPGALTYGERLARRWLTGRRYDANEVRDRYVRASSATRDVASASTSSAVYGSAGYGFRAARAASCTPFSGDDMYNVSGFKRDRIGLAGYEFWPWARTSSCTPFSGLDINNVSAFKDIDSRKLRAAESVRSGAAVASSAATSAAAASSSVASQRMSREMALMHDEVLLQHDEMVAKHKANMARKLDILTTRNICGC